MFTDSHAYYQWANFYADLGDLGRIDWPLLQRRDFKRDAEDLSKLERYQAEALIHQHCPIEALLGVVCYNEEIKNRVEQCMNRVGSRAPSMSVMGGISDDSIYNRQPAGCSG